MQAAYLKSTYPKEEQLKALTAAAIDIEGYREAYQGQILKIYSAYEPITGQRPDSTITQSQYQFTRPPKTTFRINPKERSRSSSSGNSRSDSNKDERPRLFDLKAKATCWANAEIVPNRHPERWRKDAAGNVVCKRFCNCQGCLCFEYDHIIPYSKDKELDIIEMAVYGDAILSAFIVYTWGGSRKRCRCHQLVAAVGDEEEEVVVLVEVEELDDVGMAGEEVEELVDGVSEEALVDGLAGKGGGGEAAVDDA
ncbi:hypothetical protein RJ640_003318 [Escallonia rubra]|uniref:Uncharacterized protein n=1 Tax=Escallonia rubra TaxID=112253 RepID=A0AA88QKG9_9ASTE|nr:hypothetical protein RJ640_003318 [Escallonia rubra]